MDPRKNDQQRVSESCDKRIHFRCKKKAGTRVAVGGLHNLSVAAGGWYAKEKKKRGHRYCPFTFCKNELHSGYAYLR